MPFNLRRLNVRNGAYLSLSDTYKHGDCKQILWFCLRLLEAEPQPRTFPAHVRHIAITNLTSFIDELDACDAVVSDDARNDVLRSAWTFMEAMQRLTTDFGWRMRPKMHAFHECLTTFSRSRLNPMYMQCWMEEDLMGVVAKISRKTHGLTTARSTLQRYIIKKLLLWRGAGSL